MIESFPTVYLVRHGETAWSLTGQHTGLTDLPLTQQGQANAARLGTRLRGLSLSHVLTSPLQRAVQTCEIAALAVKAEREPDLVEWNYGEYEGRMTAEIRAKHPDWQLFRDGCPGGESLAQISARANGVVNRLRVLTGDSLLFFEPAFSRRPGGYSWLGLEPSNGKCFPLSTASVSALGCEHTGSGYR